jgi:outer membrane protein OmpA-like peptidoglycan-associated protein
LARESKIPCLTGKSILAHPSAFTFKVTMIGENNYGLKIKKDTTVQISLWTPSKNEEEIRFSILYEFNESKAINIYEKYLTDIVIPKIVFGSKVIIHGYTDIIGDEAYNKTLSLARANDAQNILHNGLTQAGRNDVAFEVYGFGEDPKLSQFDNKFAEQRFYNRSVVIDIIPKK